MHVRFWGTRGSIATPGPDTIRFGGNTSCVEVTTNSGACFILDCGTGARQLGAALMARKTPVNATILLSHTHWDHIQGFPFFAPLFVPGNRITVCGPEGSGRSLRQVLSGQMEFDYFPVEIEELSAAITFKELGEGEHEFEGVRVIAQYLHHPTMTLGYRIEADGVSVVYLCDHEPYSETLWHDNLSTTHSDAIVHHGDRRHASFMARADLVIHDAQYTPEEYPSKKTWGHSTYEYAVGLAAAVKVRQLALTHHDPSHDDAILCAYEGLELTLESRGARTLAVAPPAPHADRAALGRRILVVDDDADIRALANKALTQDGHTVSEAASGREALALIASKVPDLLVLDLLMPEQGGLEILQILRSKPETAMLPVVVLTAMGDEINTRSGFALGATDYVTKPFSIPQLAARVRACFARTP